MGGKTAIAAGLVTGLVAGGILMGAVLALTPVATPASSPSDGPTEPPALLPSPSPSAGASASPVSASPPAPVSASQAASPSASPSVDPQAAFGVGKAAPPLAAAGLAGGELTVTGLRGKPVWVNFMATWCPPCRDELPRLNAFAARYADTGLVVLAVDVREDAATVEAFMKELGVTFPVGIDTDGTAQSDWGAYALPVHFWVDADGVVRDGALGGIGPDVMARGLQTILPGVTVTP